MKGNFVGATHILLFSARHFTAPSRVDLTDSIWMLFKWDVPNIINQAKAKRMNRSTYAAHIRGMTIKEDYADDAALLPLLSVSQQKQVSQVHGQPIPVWGHRFDFVRLIAPNRITSTTLNGNFKLLKSSWNWNWEVAEWRRAALYPLTINWAKLNCDYARHIAFSACTRRSVNFQFFHENRSRTSQNSSSSSSNNKFYEVYLK